MTVLGLGGAPLGDLFVRLTDDDADAILGAPSAPGKCARTPYTSRIPTALWDELEAKGLLRPGAPVPK